MALLSVAASPSTEFSGRSGGSTPSPLACTHPSSWVSMVGVCPFHHVHVLSCRLLNSSRILASVIQHVGTWSSDAPGDICHTDALCPTAVCARSVGALTPIVSCADWVPSSVVDLFSILYFVHPAGAVRVAGSDMLLICHPCWSRRGLPLPS